MSKRVYLAGPIQGKEDEQDYRERLRGWLAEKGYEVYDPWLSELKLNGDWRNNHEVRKKIVEGDLEAIRKSDALLAYVPVASTGTSMEIFYANRVNGIPTFIIYKRKEDVSPWLSEHATRIYMSIADFKDKFTEDFKP